MKTGSKTVIVTDVGEFPSPEDFDRRHNAAVKRKNGGIDRRYKYGRAMAAEEDALIWKLTKKHLDLL